MNSYQISLVFFVTLKGWVQGILILFFCNDFIFSNKFVFFISEKWYVKPFLILLQIIFVKN